MKSMHPARFLANLDSSDSNYDHNNGMPKDFTAIAPSERITVIWTFNQRSGGNKPGSMFSFCHELYYYTTTELKRVSLGFPLFVAGQQGIPSASTTPPTFQSDSIRATITQLNVSSDNTKASMSYTIQNITNSTIYLAHINDSYLLDDNLATNWDLGVTLAGIATVYASYNYNNGKLTDFTAIAPSETITIVWNFSKRSGGNKPATIFNFSHSLYYYTSTGLKQTSLGFSGISQTK